MIKKEILLLASDVGAEVRIHSVGSRETCNPAPTETDLDILIYWKGDPVTDKILDNLLGDNQYYAQGKDYGDQTDFVSYKSSKTIINIILTKHLDFEYNFLLATKICKKLNLLDKKDRISVFKGIINNEWS